MVAAVLTAQAAAPGTVQFAALVVSLVAFYVVEGKLKGDSG